MELLKWREREVMRLAPLLACGCATFVVCFVFVWFVVVLLQHRQTGAPGAGAYNTNYTASVILGFGVGTMWHYHYPNPKTKFQSQVPLARWPACVYITWPKTSLGFVPGGHWRPPESKLSNLSINTHMKPHQTKTNNTCLLGFFFLKPPPPKLEILKSPQQPAKIPVTTTSRLGPGVLPSRGEIRWYLQRARVTHPNSTYRTLIFPAAVFRFRF